MKKIKMIIAIMMILSINSFIAFAEEGYNVSLVRDEGSVIELDFILNEYELDDTEANGQKFTTIEFAHSVNTTKKGFAEIPFIYAALEVPNEGNMSAEILYSDYREYSLDAPLLPSKGVVYRNQDIEAIPYTIDPKSIVDAWYPKQLVTTSDPYILRDVRGTNVYVFPFQYNAVSNTLRVYEKISVVLKKNRSASINSLVKKDRAVLSQMKNMYSDFFLNYKEKRGIGEVGDMLVIHTSRDVSAIAPYVTWKTSNGFNVKTREVSIGTNVKSIIKDAYSMNNRLLYVQLVGDWKDIKSDFGTAPMDPMLGCVAGGDNYPDIIIGRFSANSAFDVTTQVDKTITYERSSGSPWNKVGLGIASGEGAGNGDDGEADWQHMDIIKQHKLLKFTYRNVKEVYKTGSASTVKNYVNQGLGIINYCGHGSETSFATSGFSNSDISSLSNGSKLPFIFSVACVNGKFNRAGGDCFAEAWLKKQNGGAIATVMSTINQPWQPPMRGQDYMNDLLIGGYNYSTNPGNGTNTRQGRTTFGSIVFNGLILMYAESAGPSDLETLQTWTIFGDASLKVQN